MSDKLQEEAVQRWKGLEQAVVEMIYEAVDRRLKVSWMAAGYEDDAPEIPMGMVEIVAEETIKHIPAIILWHWLDPNAIITPEKLRKTKRGRR